MVVTCGVSGGSVDIFGIGHEGTFWNDGTVLYLDLSGSYTGIYIKQPSCTFNTCILPYVIYTSKYGD